MSDNISSFIENAHISNNLSTYRRFNDKILAAELIEMLKKNGILYEVEDSTQFFDPSYAYNEALAEIRIRLLPEDFARADEMLASYYKPVLDSLERDYHLYAFTDEELFDVVAKPDEWGIVDQLLAPRILKERGVELAPNVVAMLKKNRIKELEKPEELPDGIKHYAYKERDRDHGTRMIFISAVILLLSALWRYFEE